MTTTPEQIQRIKTLCDTTKKICLALAPLSERAQRRLLAYFTDLVNDPESGATLTEVEVMNDVRRILGIDPCKS